MEQVVLYDLTNVYVPQSDSVINAMQYIYIFYMSAAAINPLFGPPPGFLMTAQA